MALIRLDKYICSQRSDISRNDVKELCRSSRVSVDGQIIRSPELKVDPDCVCVEVCGREISYKKYLYIMLNKPSGVVCSTRDGLSATVLELLPKPLRRKGLFPAGRLDKDTEGFVLITDDGGLAHRMLSPKSHVPKTYFVRLAKPLNGTELDVFEKGAVLSDGTVCLPAQLRAMSASNECEVVLHEGMFHQIKRMFESVSNEVVYLKRIRIGGLELDKSLDLGESRELADQEVPLLLTGRSNAQ